MTDLQIALSILYILIIAIVIYIEHVYIGTVWRQYERARWAVGIGTLFLVALPFVPLGVVEFFSWALLLIAALVSGGVIWLVDTSRSAHQGNKNVDSVFRQSVDEWFPNDEETYRG